MGAVLGEALRNLGEAGWSTFQAINRHLPKGESLTPKWAPGPLPKSRERTHPPLGWPRETDSLCPRCVVEVRNAIIRGERDLSDLTEGHAGEIRASIVEEDGRILMRKECPEHGVFEDVLSIDPEFTRLVETRHPGREGRPDTTPRPAAPAGRSAPEGGEAPGGGGGAVATSRGWRPSQ